MRLTDVGEAKELIGSRGAPLTMKTIPVLLALGVSVSVLQAQLVLDDFEDGTTQGWYVGDAGHPAPPANVASGGPGGVDDNFLLLRSFGPGGAGSRLAVLSGAQWAGDYTAMGVTGISMDVRNFGASDLSLRLLLEDFEGMGPPTNLAITSDVAVLPAGGGWTTVFFSLSVADLVPGVLGTPAGALASVDVVRIFHNPEATFPGPGVGIPAVVAEVGVDNITLWGTAVMTPVPEPATYAWGAALVLGAVVAWRRWGRSEG